MGFREQKGMVATGVFVALLVVMGALLYYSYYQADYSADHPTIPATSCVVLGNDQYFNITLTHTSNVSRCYQSYSGGEGIFDWSAHPGPVELNETMNGIGELSGRVCAHTANDMVYANETNGNGNLYLGTGPSVVGGSSCALFFMANSSGTKDLTGAESVNITVHWTTSQTPVSTTLGLNGNHAYLVIGYVALVAVVGAVIWVALTYRPRKPQPSMKADHPNRSTPTLD